VVVWLSSLGARLGLVCREVVGQYSATLITRQKVMQADQAQRLRKQAARYSNAWLVKCPVNAARTQVQHRQRRPHVLLRVLVLLSTRNGGEMSVCLTRSRF